MQTFDRYLLRRYWHTFGVAFIALFGLYVIFHAFTNADEFMDAGKSAGTVLRDMAEFYSYRVSQFFDMVGGSVAVIAAMVTFTLVQRHGELNPILSAGIPSYRLVWPLVLGTILINTTLWLNQEFIIPRIARHLQVDAGQGKGVRQEVEPVYDFVTQILVTGQKLHLREQRVESAEFILPVPQIAQDKLTTLKADWAEFLPGTPEQPNGWRLKGVSIPYESLKLTPRGREIVRHGAAPDELFVATDVSFDRLYKSDKSYQLLSTLELMRRLRNPSSSTTSIRRQGLYLHTRFTQPLINIIVVLLGAPLVARKESRALIINLALCALAMGSVFGLNQAFLYLGLASLIPTDLAAWGPVILSGTAAAWMSGLMRT